MKRNDKLLFLESDIEEEKSLVLGLRDLGYGSYSS